MTETHVSAASMIFFTRDRRILLQEWKDRNRFGEEWAFFGGMIEEGETPEEAIVREMREELEHALDGHVYVGHMTHRRVPGLTAEIHYYIQEFDGDLSRFALNEGSAMRLFTLEEAGRLRMMPGDHDALKMLKDVL